MFRQLLPLLRLDGYYVLADMTGVPDLFTRIKPILVSVIPGKRADKRVTELKPWVRVVVTLWVLVFVPFIVANVAYILIFAPRIFATGWDSFLTHLRDTGAAFGQGAAGAGVAGVLQLVALSLPALGIAYGLSRSSVKIVRGMWTKTGGRPISRMLGFILLGGAIGAVAALWWPDGDYRPIRPGERWTFQDAAVAASTTVSGSPVLDDDASPDRGNDQRDTGVPATSGDQSDPVLEVSPSPSVDPSITPTTSPTATEPSSTTEPSPTTSPTISPTNQPSPTTEASP
jgi:putative peptide zinc metalloprotease protein